MIGMTKAIMVFMAHWRVKKKAEKEVRERSATLLDRRGRDPNLWDVRWKQ